ncbi:MAG: DUF928 domain-containing protein [Methylacidiphilales bacterium]|nr:DUF928 domain-containing protein [Candidatus Methylacidiphilales bacterium]NJR14406.1 DUF928 domain-containing protein [Calothrix sp. CSU_2_0]
MHTINKFLFRYLQLGTALLITLSAMNVWTMPSTAARVVFKPPGDRAPKTSAGGASRDVSTCGIANDNSAVEQNVTPLLPKSNIGLTLAEHPTIFVYIPETNAKTVFFSIQDINDNNIYQNYFNLPHKSGIMQVDMPMFSPGLKVNQKYKWSLAMICTPYLEPDSPFVSGWIQRVNYRNNSQNLAVTLDSAIKLAASGLWYDTLSMLAELRRTQPNNQAFATSWQDLLKSVDLNAIANKPVIN